ncbi:hypothetical protein [Streptomyces sp. NPDC048428]|uniref:hypothetical protein n=1 Tax=Streptomyces sp. NPDC048428 TaxID=3154503 RepID=UPI0034203366
MTDERHLLIARAAQVLLRPNGSARCVRRQPDAPRTPGQLTVVGGHIRRALDRPSSGGTP